MEVYTVMATPFAFGGLNCEIKTDIQEYERVDLGEGYFGIVFKNPKSKQYHLALECCGALIGTDKSKANLIKQVKSDIETGDDKIMRTQVNKAKIDLKGAKLLENEDWFDKFRAKMQEGFVICKDCKGRKYHKVKFTYKGKNYIYYNKCALCDATGEVDWIRNAQGRIGWYFDSHPASSLMIISNTIAKNASSIYDGKKYINIHTPRGKALYYEFVGGGIQREVKSS